MGSRGPAPRPKLEVVREGNPGKKAKAKIEDQVVMPPGTPAEPEWITWFAPVRVPRDPLTKDMRAELTPAQLAEHNLAHAQAVAQARLATAEHKVARAEAAAEWRRIVPPLDAVGRLATVDRQVLVDHCVCAARLLLAERDISRNGIYVPSERGTSKNPAVTAANQYRTQLRFTSVQLMLTPAARARTPAGKGGPDGEEDDNPFDV